MISLHMHTNLSDGQDSVSDIIENVKRAGIDFFSITDHDSAKSARVIFEDKELMKKLDNYGIRFVPGAEWSCIYKGRKMHVLSYDFNPYAPEITLLERLQNEQRSIVNNTRIETLEKLGYHFSSESYKYLQEKENLRKPDIGRCLVNDGYFETTDDACEFMFQNIKTGKPHRLDLELVMEQLKKTGAKIVWAHSLGGKSEPRRTCEQIDDGFLEEVVKLGLDGLECYYSCYNREEINGLLKLADKYGLFVTCGSDYHGKVNRNVKIDQVSADGTQVPEGKIKIIEQFKYVLGNGEKTNENIFNR